MVDGAFTMEHHINHIMKPWYQKEESVLYHTGSAKLSLVASPGTLKIQNTPACIQLPELCESRIYFLAA